MVRFFSHALQGWLVTGNGEDVYLLKANGQWDHHTFADFGLKMRTDGCLQTLAVEIATRRERNGAVVRSE